MCKVILVPKIAHTGSGAHSASSSVGTAVPSRGYSGPDVKLTTHLQLAPMLRINGAMPPLPQCLHGEDRKNLPFFTFKIQHYVVLI